MTNIVSFDGETKVDPKEIDLVREVSQQNPAVMIVLFNFRTYHLKAKDVPYIEALVWLKKQRLVGDIFLEWIKTKFDNSPILALGHIREQIWGKAKNPAFIAKQR